jgi:type VI secretion system protein VasD
MTRRRAFGVGVLGALVGLLAGCAKPPPPPPPPPPGVIELTIKAGGDINPDVDGRASPVVVRVYQLASDAKFNAVDFFQLFDKEAATLGADLIGREEVVVSPGDTKKLSSPLKPNAQFVGIAAAFRDIDKAQWRATVDVPPNGTTPLEATLKGISVTLAKSGS